MGNGSFCGITEETQLGNGYNVTIEQIMAHKVVVGAVQNLGNNTFQTASYSNYGKYVDVVAPGSSIYSARPDDKSESSPALRPPCWEEAPGSHVERLPTRPGTSGVTGLIYR